MTTLQRKYNRIYRKLVNLEGEIDRVRENGYEPDEQTMEWLYKVDYYAQVYERLKDEQMSFREEKRYKKRLNRMFYKSPLRLMLSVLKRKGRIQSMLR